MKKEVNANGDICPIPLVKAKEAIKEKLLELVKKL